MIGSINDNCVKAQKSTNLEQVHSCLLLQLFDLIYPPFINKHTASNK